MILSPVCGHLLVFHRVQKTVAKQAVSGICWCFIVVFWRIARSDEDAITPLKTIFFMDCNP